MKKNNSAWIFLEVTGLALGLLFLQPTFSFSCATSPEDAAPAISTDLEYTLLDVGPNQPPTINSLKPDKEMPGRAGSIIQWTGTASDSDGDRVLYQFWLNGPSTGHIWKAMTNWSGDNVWNWSTSSADIGNNIIELRVRDGHHAGPDRWDDLMSAEYLMQVDLGSKPTLISIKPDKQSPQPQGSTIAWTANALDPDGDTVLYQFWLKGPSTNDEWMATTPWTTNNVWVWNSAQSSTGIYTIEARVRDGYHAGAEGSDDFKRVGYVIRLFVK